MRKPARSLAERLRAEVKAMEEIGAWVSQGNAENNRSDAQVRALAKIQVWRAAIEKRIGDAHLAELEADSRAIGSARSSAC